MKKFLLYALTAVVAVGATSCKDDEVMAVINPAEDFDRMPMTMFRLLENTGVSDDPYGMQIGREDPSSAAIIKDVANTAHLAWYGIEGAAGYEIKYGIAGQLSSGRDEDWNDPERLTDIIRIDNPDQLTLDIPNLEYSTSYRFAIRVLNPDGVEAHHSKWYGYGDGRQWAEQAGLTTLERYATPGVINVGNIAPDRSAFTVYMNISVKDAVEGYCGSKATEQEKIQCFEDFRKNFEMEAEGADDYTTARFKVTTLAIAPAYETPNASVDEKWRNYSLSSSDFNEDGTAEFRVTGLQENAIYLCNAINSDIPVDVDARYNTIRKPVYGDPGDPIEIPHVVRATDSIPGETRFNACQLDDILGKFATDITLAEGQTFYLQGGKAYYFFNNPEISKGFVLATNPEDLKEGKRAIVYLGGIGVGLENDGVTPTATLKTCNFMFGRQKRGGEADCPIEVGTVKFKDIDFDCPLAYDFGDCSDGTNRNNYFANMYSDGMAVTFESVEVENCTFQNMMRGFVRVQGSKQALFNKVLVNNCVFYNSGYRGYGKTGGYSLISDGQQKQHQLMKNVIFTNNTIYDWSSADMIGKDKASSCADWTGCDWSLRFENNTIINYGTENKHYIFNNQRYPDKFNFVFKNNLFVLTVADDDTDRPIDFRGVDIRNAWETGLGEDISVDICNNYSISSRPAKDGDNKIFSGNAFNNSSNSFAPGNMNYNGTTRRLVNSEEDLIVKSVMVDGEYLRPSQLFNQPNTSAKYVQAKDAYDLHCAPSDIWNALKYKTVPAELNGIGDPRWANADPKNCYNDVE
ncbi:MAG: hypothetical protein K2G27_06390 [Duncaniella sp.]|nr:hypothetical protein [Duncaniella sp.]